ncbi:uncharacterized protein JCM6883_005297 [Sporobolomyces salmoneus]|uniref:uncharacterized protein n=1 Tax=Sporobolomyces salmoneus TaxID=183962 RepID=UPI00317F855E
MSDQPASFAPLSPNETRARTRSLTRRPSHSSLATGSSSAHPTGSTARTSSSTTTSSAPAVPPLPVPSVSSPHYSTSLRSRHSLYGTEDRIVLDLGSRVWKVGFSGEACPRYCVGVDKLLAREEYALQQYNNLTRRGDRGGEEEEEDEKGIWGLEKGDKGEEEWQVSEERLKRGLRQVWFDHLMTDPKTRKVLVVENPLLSTQVKDMIARVLFDNLQVPSINFASAPLLSLMTAGSVTGLVVDVGHLETTVLPIFHARPMFSKLVSTPLAGARLNSRLRSLLLAYGSYAPPPASLNSMTIPQPTRVPRRVLTEELIEEIKTRCCFVGDEVVDDETLLREYDEALNERYRREASSPSVDTTSTALELDEEDPDSPLLKYLYNRYSRTCPSTTSLSFRIPHLSSPPPPSGVGKGHLSIPSWIRERSTELLFDSTLETPDSLSIQSTILECVLSLPIDLRKPMMENLLVVGGTASIPGFIPRLKRSLLTRLRESHPPSPPTTPPPTIPTEDQDPTKRIRRNRLSNRLHSLRHSPRYAPLVSLASSLSILNNPSPSPSPSSSSSSSLSSSTEGSAPGFNPSLYAWIGGSLAGSLKVGGEEIGREEWDESYEGSTDSRRRKEEEAMGEEGGGEEGEESFEREGTGSGTGLGGRRERERRGKRLMDWSRSGYA